jgi:hypothetical protein
VGLDPWLYVGALLKKAAPTPPQNSSNTDLSKESANEINIVKLPKLWKWVKKQRSA